MNDNLHICSQQSLIKQQKCSKSCFFHEWGPQKTKRNATSTNRRKKIRWIRIRSQKNTFMSQMTSYEPSDFSIFRGERQTRCKIVESCKPRLNASLLEISMILKTCLEVNLEGNSSQDQRKIDLKTHFQTVPIHIWKRKSNWINFKYAAQNLVRNFSLNNRSSHIQPDDITP